MQAGAVELSERRDGVTYLGEPLASWDNGQAELAKLVLDRWPSSADAHLEATLAEHRQRVRFPRSGPRRAYGRGVHPGADPYFGELRCEGQRRAWRRLPFGDVGHQQRRVAAVCDATNPISPGPQISCERANDPEPEGSGHGRGHFSSFDCRSGALIVHPATHNTSPSRLEIVRPPGGAKFIAYERLEEVEGAVE